MTTSFFDLTNQDDRFEITPGLITNSPDGVRALGGNDIIMGSPGADTISGNQGDDLLSGLGGPDVLTGGRNWDTLDGGDDNDVLFGNRGNDLLVGGEGGDLLFGGRALDRLEGGLGNDTLWGDLGADTLTGGEGEDIFVLRPDDPDTDIITDWNFSVDRIGLAFGLTFDQIQAVPLSTGLGDPTNPTDPAQPPADPTNSDAPPGVTLQLVTGQILAIIPDGRVEHFTLSRFVTAI